ncbi:protein of unknown function [Latilactobacillus sakei]|nr:protein of unknown function [Latilactobacillus sakei]
MSAVLFYIHQSDILCRRVGNSHSTAQLEKRAKKQSESKLRAQSSAKKTGFRSIS